jgi:UDP-N-acetyl-D-mannosaminuronic acid dehydrogenase
LNIAVIGLGYIGLPTAALLAEAGHRVYGYDANARLRRNLMAGEIPNAEAPVCEVATEALRRGRLLIVDRIPSVHAYILCLPTPTHEGKPDLRYVEAAAAAVANVAEPGSILVLESTVPPGATERVFGRALEAAGKRMDDFCIAHCPERVIPGAIIEELRGNARVIGGRVPADARVVRELYASFCEGPISLTSTRVAEFVKIVENTYRDVNIAFANELAVISEELDINVWEAIALANKHPRVNILQPGPGVGGHCIPVDPQFLSDANPLVTELIQAARRVNDRMPYRIVRRISTLVEPGAGRKIAILGAAYKADVDDARESPAARIDALLRDRGYATAIYDPHVKQFHRPLAHRIENAAADADALVLVTPHTCFKEIRPEEMAPIMRTPRLVDTRNFFDIEHWRESGFECYLLGRSLEIEPAAASAVA